MRIRKPLACIADSDEVHSQELISSLSEGGFQVRRFVDGGKLIRFLFGDGSKYRPSLIILDVSSGRLGGFEAARRLTDSPETADIPIIIMAKYCSPEDKIEAQTAGAITCMPKPLDLNQVQAELQSRKSRRAKNELAVKKDFKVSFD